jgi:hypothetical protein
VGCQQQGKNKHPNVWNAEADDSEWQVLKDVTEDFYLWQKTAPTCMKYIHVKGKYWNIVTWCLKGEIAEPERWPLLRNGSANTPIARQWPSLVMWSQQRETTETVFPMESVLRIFNEDQLHVLNSWESAVCSESMRVAWDGRQPARTWAWKKWNVSRWKQHDWEHSSVCCSDL